MPPEVAVVPTDEDNFTSAFEMFSEDETKPAVVEAKPVAEVKPVDEAAKVAAEDAKTVESLKPVTTVDPLVEEPTKAEDGKPVVAVPKNKDDDDAAMLARFTEIAKNTAPVETNPAAEPRRAAPQMPEVYTAEEKKFLETYEKDWPDVAKAESLRRRAEYRDIVGYVFQQFSQQMTPLSDAVRELSTRTHLGDLHNKVTDYDDVRDKVVDWVTTQPTYLQVAYKHVIEEGTVDEVADLITRYKQATGVKPAPAVPVVVTKKADTELPPATKQAAAALAPVSSKRSAITQGIDPNDFGAAFSDFASKLN